MGHRTGEMQEKGTGVQVGEFEVLTSSYQLTPQAQIRLGYGSLVVFGPTGGFSPRFLSCSLP